MRNSNLEFIFGIKYSNSRLKLRVKLKIRAFGSFWTFSKNYNPAFTRLGDGSTQGFFRSRDRIKCRNAIFSNVQKEWRILNLNFELRLRISNSEFKFQISKLNIELKFWIWLLKSKFKLRIQIKNFNSEFNLPIKNLYF